MGKITFLILVIVYTIFSPLSTFATQDETQNIFKVRLQLKWKHQFQFAGYYAAIEQGYYKQKGIEVELIEAMSGVEPGMSVFNGEAEFGTSTSDVVLMRQKGYDPVVLATIFQHSAQVLITSTSSGISNVQQLIGKKIALEPHAADIITYMKDEGVALDQCSVTHHYFSPDQLIKGEVDAITGYITDEPFLLDQKNFDYRILTPQMGGIDFYGDLLFCSQKLVKKEPEMVADFVDASVQGWKYALDNMDEIIDVIYNKYSRRHTLEHLRHEAEHTKQLIMPDVVEVGYSNPGRWESIFKIYEKAKLIENTNSRKGLLYADYLKKEKEFPLQYFLIFTSLILVVSSIALFFYLLVRKLRNQVNIIVETENALQDSEHKLSSILLNLPGMVFRSKNDKDWTMLYLNDNCFELTGYKAEELLDNKLISYNDLIHPDDREDVNEFVQKGIDYNKSYDGSYRIITKSQEVKWVWEKGNGNFSDSGEFQFVEGLIFDITEKVKAEEELKHYQENLEEMVTERTQEIQNKNVELEKYNELFIGREFRIKELKEKLKVLEDKLKRH